MRQDDRIALLRTAELFSVLEEQDVLRVGDEVELVSLPGQQILFAQGDLGDSLYVVLSGRLRVLLELENGSHKVLGEVGRGETVGEMALLTGEPRSATVLAIRDTELFRLSKAAFDRIVERNPRVMMLIAQRLVARLRDTGRGREVNRVSTIAAVPLGSDVPIHDFVMRLSAALAKIDSTLYLTAARLDGQFGEGTAKLREEAILTRVNDWLDTQERQFRYVVYEGEEGDSLWTARCLRQADRILLVGRASRSPAEGAIDSVVRHIPTDRDLVLLHPESTRRPTGTGKWLERYGVDTCYHVKTAVPQDYERLARALTGACVSVALSGGGARGFAHIGVIRALREAGVPIDAIGGTSMGAAIAAQVALGLDHRNLIDINRRGWIGVQPLKDKTIPIVSLLTGRRLEKMLALMFDDACIEDLWIRYCCVSADLTHAVPIVHKRGSLRGALRATLSIPGLTPPVCDNGRLIIDGGVLNNLPGDVLRDLAGGAVIAVDVSPQRDLAVDPAWLRVPSAWQILWSRINPFRKSIEAPGLVALMMRTLMLSSVYSSHNVQKQVDLYIRPPVDEFAIFEWHSLEKIVDAGYRFAQARIEEWKSGKQAEGNLARALASRA